MNTNVSEMLNHQIRKELYSAYLYLHFSNLLAEDGLPGFSHWFHIQAKEELEHAMMFVNYLQSNGGQVCYESIPKPETGKLTLSDIVSAALAHEQSITESIDQIYDAAETQKDYRTRLFLDGFVREQGEEEENAKVLVQKVEVLGGSPKGRYLLDQELGRRVYHPHGVSEG